MKNLIFSLIFLTVLFSPNISYGQSNPPTQIPFVGPPAPTKTETKVNVLNQLVNPSVFNGKDEGKEPLSRLLNQLFYVGLLIAVIAAIVVIIMGGVQYMTVDAISSKEGGKNKVKAALGGLLLAFSAILIFNSINPGITSFIIKFPTLSKVSKINLSGLESASRGLDENGNPIYVPSTPSGEGSINPMATAYSPKLGGDSMEGGYESSRPGLDGRSLVRTLDDYANGNSPYITLAADSALYGRSYIIPQITYINSNGQSVTLTDVKGYVHDTGSAFTGKGTSRIDIPVGKDYATSQTNIQPFSKQNIEFIPAK